MQLSLLDLIEEVESKPVAPVFANEDRTAFRFTHLQDLKNELRDRELEMRSMYEAFEKGEISAIKFGDYEIPARSKLLQARLNVELEIKKRIEMVFGARPLLHDPHARSIPDWPAVPLDAFPLCSECGYSIHLVQRHYTGYCHNHRFEIEKFTA